MRNRVFLGCGQTLRFAVPFAVVTVCLYLIGERFDFALLASIPDRLGSIPLWALLLSLALTAISFWAVGKNEQVAHTYLQTGISGRHADLGLRRRYRRDRALAHPAFAYGNTGRFRLLCRLRFLPVILCSCRSFGMSLSARAGLDTSCCVVGPFVRANRPDRAVLFSSVKREGPCIPTA